MIVVNAVIESSEEDIRMLKTAIADMEAASRQEAGCFDYTSFRFFLFIIT